MPEILSYFLHIDKYLGILFDSYGPAVYFILFLIILGETGLVIAPFLPGDSLLFIAGTFAGIGSLNIYLLFFLFSLAAILGDSLNYFVGAYFGKKISKDGRFIRQEHLDKTNAFYEKHGGKTIILARFMPIVRTFAPFVAGMGKMNYSKFFAFNIIGGILWVSIFVFGGFFFGGIPSVKENLSYVIILIVIVSFMPIFYEFLKRKIR